MRPLEGQLVLDHEGFQILFHGLLGIVKAGIQMIVGQG